MVTNLSGEQNFFRNVTFTTSWWPTHFMSGEQTLLRNLTVTTSRWLTFFMLGEQNFLRNLTATGSRCLLSAMSRKQHFLRILTPVLTLFEEQHFLRNVVRRKNHFLWNFTSESSWCSFSCNVRRTAFLQKRNPEKNHFLWNLTAETWWCPSSCYLQRPTLPQKRSCHSLVMSLMETGGFNGAVELRGSRQKGLESCAREGEQPIYTITNYARRCHIVPFPLVLIELTHSTLSPHPHPPPPPSSLFLPPLTSHSSHARAILTPESTLNGIHPRPRLLPTPPSVSRDKETKWHSEWFWGHLLVGYGREHSTWRCTPFARHV